jgi:tRNA(Ile)-lysidine synthase
MSNHPPAFTAERLLHILQSLPPVDTYLVGFSGGADSTALLHALSVIQDQLNVPVCAVHINHGLHGDADLWQSRCESFCKLVGIELVSLEIKPGKQSGKGLEAEARQLRYEAICTLLEPGTCLLTAHHADDQAETLLLNLMRGSGVDGLSAMPDSRPLGKGMLQRPLLEFQGSALRDYVKSQNLEWSEDPSNQYLDHDRNFVRHEIIPLLEQRWPAVSKRLLLTRKAMTGARHLLERTADDYLDRHLDHPLILAVAPNLAEDPELFKLVIRRWVKLADLPHIPSYSLESLHQQVSHSSRNHNVTMHWAEYSLRLFKQQLWLMPDREIQPCPTLDWPGENMAIDLGEDVGHLSLEGDKPALPAGNFSVGNRRGMEHPVISQGGYHKSLKNLFQSAEVPPWLRECIPLCKLDGELVAMGDWCFEKRFETWLSSHSIRLVWQPVNPLLKFIRGQQGADLVDPADAVR